MRLYCFARHSVLQQKQFFLRVRRAPQEDCGYLMAQPIRQVKIQCMVLVG